MTLYGNEAIYQRGGSWGGANLHFTPGNQHGTMMLGLLIALRTPMF